MAASKYITIEGQFANGVLGAFRIIRGFATLQDLAAISVPFPMHTPVVGQPIHGHQRAIDEKHSEEIKNYLENGKPRFIPEVILSVRAEVQEVVNELQEVIGVASNSVDGLVIERTVKAKNNPTHRIRIENSKLAKVRTDSIIRRIDGNHRLDKASELANDSLAPSKYLAPFCVILLGSPGDQNDDFVEAMLFETINSTALPLDSEHALTLVLGQDAAFRGTDAEEFATNAPLHLTRLLKNHLDVMPQVQKERLGNTAATVLNSAAIAMVNEHPEICADIATLGRFANELAGAITDILSRLSPNLPDLCRADFFIELATLAWSETDANANRNERIDAAVSTLDAMGRWLDHDGLHNIQSKRSIAAQLFEIYRSVRLRIPKRVFLSRWYPQDEDGAEKHRADLRLQGVARTLVDLRLEGIELALDDPGTNEGGTFGIHKEMYDALSRNDIILVDLSGVRPNVCIEAGYALKHLENGRLIFLFQPTEVTENNKTAWTNPPFDLTTFRYEKIADSGDIPVKLIPHNKSIYAAAMNGEN
jgi:hypothetical protein